MLISEWQPQQAVILVWPHTNSDWRHNLQSIEKNYIAIVKVIASSQAVVIIANSTALKAQIVSCFDLATLHNLQVIVAQTNDTWIRDYGPLSVKIKDSIIHYKFAFNGYGNKYEHALDNSLVQTLTNLHYLPQAQQVPMILEGGSIDINDRGVLLTTNTCVGNINRHQDYSLEQITSIFHEHLGAKQIFWLEDCALAGDDTDGHIDNLVRFINNDTIFYAANHYQAAKDTKIDSIKAQLESKLSKQYKLVPIPMPKVIYHQGKCLPASYLNFLITNDAIIVPSYGDAMETKVNTIFNQYKGHRQIKWVNCLELIKQGGGIHCASMQSSLGVNT